MRPVVVLVSWLVGGLITGILIWYLPPKVFARYTARTFVRVLPASQNLSGPVGNYPASAVALVKSQNTLESLVKSAEIQRTGWFSRLGATQDERMINALSELKKRLNAETLPAGDLIAVSLTCRDGRDAAIVLNEIVGLFLKRQDAAERKRIVTDLGRLEEQMTRIQRDLEQSKGIWMRFAPDTALATSSSKAIPTQLPPGLLTCSGRRMITPSK